MPFFKQKYLSAKEMAYFGAWNDDNTLDNNAKLLLILRAYLTQFSQLEIMRTFLGKRLVAAPENMRDVVLVGVDMEWFDRGNNDVTEIGLAVLDTYNITDPGQSFKTLEETSFCHARIKETAHMVNHKLGQPDKFQYGHTKFVTKLQATHILHDAFTHFRSDGTMRPVVFLGHAVDNDINMLKEQFGLDLDQLGVVVETLDTQVMAQEMGIQSQGPLIGLGSLLKHFGLKEEYLHTAGNDIASTLVSSLLLADIQGFSERRRPKTMHNGKDISSCFRQLKMVARVNNNPSLGDDLFCTKCDSAFHLVSSCRVLVQCEKCAASEIRKKAAGTHKTEKCGVDAGEGKKAPLVKVLVPCERCAASSDEKRSSKTKTHMADKCGYAHLDRLEDVMM